jgi:hypothetical protein
MALRCARSASVQAIVFEDLGVSSRLQQKSILADIHKFIEEEHVVK